MNALEIKDIVFWLIDVVKELIPLAAAGWFALRLFFKQKEHESITSRYLEGGIDKVASGMSENLDAYRNNWARTLHLLKEYREYGDKFDTKEFTKGYAEIHAGNLESIANRRVYYLTGSPVFYNAYQSVLAFCVNSNNEMEKEIAKAIEISMSEKGKKIDSSQVINKVEKALFKLNAEADLYEPIVTELVNVGGVLEKQKISYEKLENLRKNDQVTKAVQNVEAALKRIESESHVMKDNSPMA